MRLSHTLRIGLTSGIGILVGIGTAEPLQAADRIWLDENIEVRNPFPLKPKPPRTSPFATAAAETVWVGYQPSSTDPNKVGVGGLWDWDTGVAGTDSTQFWTFYQADWRSENATALPDPLSRPAWHLDHGNEINIGDTNLWATREAAGTIYRRTGIVGAWHRDPMTALPGSSGPINGSASAWCGLRAAEDETVRDELTNNAINGSLTRQWLFATTAAAQMDPVWPGYGDQWDQMLYRDVPGNSGTLTFKLRTDLSRQEDTATNGSGWFNPDPLAAEHYSHQPIDSFMVWIGLPQESGVYDTNRRWLSEVIDFNAAGVLQPQKVYTTEGKVPISGGLTDTMVTVSVPDLGPTVRIVFQVKTNRIDSDEISSATGFESIDGAAVIDDVIVGAKGFDFEDLLSIRPRALINSNGSLTEIDPTTAWITTGKSPSVFGHIEGISNLPYEDVCGPLDSPIRICNLAGNVMLQSDHDDGDVHFRESWNFAVSPTIKLYPGNPQGIPEGMQSIVMDLDLYSGDALIETATFWMFGVQYTGPNFTQPQGEPGRFWGKFLLPPFILFGGLDSCWRPFEVIEDLSEDLQFLIPVAEVDSLQVCIGVQTRCSRFGSTVLCGNTQGMYFDNVQVGVLPEASELVGEIVFPYWDTFPFNESISPGLAAFDTTTALMKLGGSSVNERGAMTSDSVWVQAPYADEIRMDLVFRILPGPGNYSVAGDQSSPLVEKDPARPFWSSYLADNGAYGTPGGHASTWNPNVWNSVRIDSAEQNLYPIEVRQLGGPAPDFWATTLHEDEPRFDVLGIERNICFLVNPNGANNSFNICCSTAQCASVPFFESHPPSSYPFGIQTSTKEGTQVLPDGYFTSGTHIEYFVRRSLAANPQAGVVIRPDTADVAGNWNFERWVHTDVLPDLWKDERYGGQGLACMLVVDECVAQPSLLGALDTLGYGKNNGASVGWKRIDPAGSDNPNDPGGFVAANLGQMGLAIDWYDVGAGLGCRLATIDASENSAQVIGRQCKAGPTPDMLKHYYTAMLWDVGLCFPPNDIDFALMQDFLLTSEPREERGLWFRSGATPFFLNDFSPETQSLITGHMGTLFRSRNYFTLSGNQEPTSVFDPVASELLPEKQYGMRNDCGAAFSIVLDVNTAVSGPVAAALYEDQSHRGNTDINPFGPYVASVYFPANPGAGRHFSTLFDAFEYYLLTGNGPGNSQTDLGRISWMDGALSALTLCRALGPVVAVGDLPGLNGAYLNFVRGSYPNPMISGQTRVEFSLFQPAKVQIRFYNIAGRLVHRANLEGTAGANVYPWDGRTHTGRRAAPGVYFYRLSAPDIEFKNNRQKMVILGSRMP